MSARQQIEEAVSRALATLRSRGSPRRVHLERPARPRARRLVDQRRARQRQEARPPAEGPCLRAGGDLTKDPPPHLVERRGCRPGLREPAARPRMAPRHPRRGGRPKGSTSYARSRPRPRRARPGRVHLRQSDRPAPCRERLVGLLRRRPRPGHGAGRAGASSASTT